eukprot:TRINITY_DN15642_c0_g1_i1.p2 TRINITY_DN15642_c0_g1~~TRINITY_DN15642_c0_g1_i1.p2  ORF type:complete len:119 (+),score=36.53 TRINITY_DN15642_c0_g1_i1:615-971(+)
MKGENWIGRGKATFKMVSQNKVMEGTWTEAGLHGQGRINIQKVGEESSYEGNWKDGKQNGYGVGRLRMAQGEEVYEGEWNEGRKWNGKTTQYLRGAVFASVFEVEKGNITKVDQYIVG